MPAEWIANFKDRETLREDMAADIMIYDLTRLAIGPTEITRAIPASE